jgi:hypothetical protein
MRASGKASSWFLVWSDLPLDCCGHDVADRRIYPDAKATTTLKGLYMLGPQSAATKKSGVSA